MKGRRGVGGGGGGGEIFVSALVGNHTYTEGNQKEPICTYRLKMKKPQITSKNTCQ